MTNGPSAHQWKKIHALGAEQWFPRESIFVSGEMCIRDRPCGDRSVCDRLDRCISGAYAFDLAVKMREKEKENESYRCDF